MDVAVPALEGINATRIIKAQHPDTAVLALTAYEDEGYIFAASKLALRATCEELPQR